MPKVSIIIPIYKVEKYIERCAKSLFEQTEEDLEFIFVNDGTPDNSMQILNDVIRDYPSRKNQIKIFENEKNLGLPLTRQRGIKESTGEYIIHCDSDDWVDGEMYRMLYEKAKADDLDIVWCDFYRADGVTNTYEIQNTSLERLDILKDILTAKKIATLWNHLVKRDILFEHTYMKSVSNNMEDLVQVFQYFYYSKKIGYINVPLYYYYYNFDSMSTSGSEEKEILHLAEVEANFEVLFSFIEQNNLNIVLKNEIFYRKLETKNWMLLFVKRAKECSLWLDKYKEINSRFFYDYNIRLKYKFIYFLIVLRIYPLLNRIQRKIVSFSSFYYD